MDMLTITAAEFQRHFGRYQDEALKQPVSITRNGRERLVVLAVEEYQRLKQRDRRAIRAEELTDEEIALIARAEVPAEHAYLDEELDAKQP